MTYRLDFWSRQWQSGKETPADGDSCQRATVACVVGDLGRFGRNATEVRGSERVSGGETLRPDAR
jgi:hypothetical protein